METIILVAHLLIALALVGVVLMQKSEGGLGGLGGSSGGSMGSLLGGIAAANLLTRATGILAGTFFLTSIGLAILAGGGNSSKSITEKTPPATSQIPVKPAKPTVPTGE